MEAETARWPEKGVCGWKLAGLNPPTLGGKTLLLPTITLHECVLSQPPCLNESDRELVKNKKIREEGRHHTS